MPEGQDGVTATADPVGTPAAPNESQNGQANPNESSPQVATQDGQGASVEESFTAIDPKTLSPEMLAIQKRMQADYTRKMMEVAEIKKLMKDPQFQAAYQAYLNPQQAAVQEEPTPEGELDITDEEFNQAFQTKEGMLQLINKVAMQATAKAEKRLQKIEDRESLTKAGEMIEEFASQKGREDFWELDDNYKFISYQIAVNPPKSEAEYAQRLEEAYTNAKNIYGDIYKKGYEAARAEMQKKVDSSSLQPTGAHKATYSGDPKKWTVEEAVANARKGIRVPQKYD